MVYSQESQELVFESAYASAMRAHIFEFFRLSDVDVPEEVKVEVTEDPVLAERFPAVLHWNEGERAASILYSKQAVADVANEFGTDAKTFAAVEQLYLAGSLALGVLLKSVGSTINDPEKLNILLDQFTNTTEVERGIDQLRATSVEDRIDLKCGLCHSSQERLCRIGALRFVTGLYSILREDTNGFDDLRKIAHESITNALRNRKVLSLILSSAHVFTDSEITERLDKQFTEAISEVSLALAFPMDIEELRAMVMIATFKPDGKVYSEGERVVEVPKEGFHEVD